LDLQGDLAALSTNSDHRVVDATHGRLIDYEASHELSVRAIIDVIQSVRTEQPLPATNEN